MGWVWVQGMGYEYENGYETVEMSVWPAKTCSN